VLPTHDVRYECDECSRKFGGPVWHCLSCGRHNAPQYRSCRECRQPCPFEANWDQGWQTAIRAGITPESRPTRYRTDRERVTGQLHGVVIRLSRARTQLSAIASGQGEGRGLVRRKLQALFASIDSLIADVRACRPVNLKGT